MAGMAKDDVAHQAETQEFFDDHREEPESRKLMSFFKWLESHFIVS